MTKYIIACLAIIFSSHFLHSQDEPIAKSSEFFLSLGNISPVSFALEYKRQVNKNMFLKFGMIDLTLKTNSSISKNNIRSGLNYTMGIETGIEFRKSITENLTLFHGPALSMSYGNNISRIDTISITSVQSPTYQGSIPYSIGALIKINEHYLFAVEIRPGVSVQYKKFASGNYNISSNIGFSNRIAYLSFAYRL